MKHSIMAKVALLLFCMFLLTGIQNGFSAEIKKYYVVKYGAVNDGITLNTKAIQKAIDDANKHNGGIVVFTKGWFLSGSLILKSGVQLMFEEGAVLLGSTNPRDYQKLEIKNAPVSPKTDDNSKLALLLAYNAKDISITGKGTIDGQGRQLALIIDSLHFAGVMIDPHYTKRTSETMRPKIIHFVECENVKVSAVTIQNSSCWVQTYELCTNVMIDSVSVMSRAYWNNDGLDITDCKRVRITNCNVNTADDGICLKSYYPGHYNDDIYIDNCSIRTSASAVKFGTASIGGFKNVIIKNINVQDTYRSAVAIESVDGGFIENVSVSDIKAQNTGNAFFIRLGHRSGEKPGTIKNVSIKNIKVQVPFGRPDIDYDMRGPALPYPHNQFPVSIAGIPGSYVENVTIENIKISYPGRASKGMAYIPLWRLDQVPEKIIDYPEYTMFGELPSWGFYVRHVNNIDMKDIKLSLDASDFRPAFIFNDVKNLNIERLRIPDDKKEQIILKDVKGASLDKESSLYMKEF